MEFPSCRGRHDAHMAEKPQLQTQVVRPPVLPCARRSPEEEADKSLLQEVLRGSHGNISARAATAPGHAARFQPLRHGGKKVPLKPMKLNMRFMEKNIRLLPASALVPPAAPPTPAASLQQSAAGAAEVEARQLCRRRRRHSRSNSAAGGADSAPERGGGAASRRQRPPAGGVPPAAGRLQVVSQSWIPPAGGFPILNRPQSIRETEFHKTEWNICRSFMRAEAKVEPPACVWPLCFELVSGTPVSLECFPLRCSPLALQWMS